MEKTKFKKKIQLIIRRPNREEKAEELTNCPISGHLIPSTELECPTTKDSIPMCVCTGKHMVLDDWCFCPVSGMPALFSEYQKYIQMEALKSDENKKASAFGTKEGGDNESATLSNDFNQSSLDPVFGKRVSSLDIAKCSRQEAIAYISAYNTFVEKKSIGGVS